VKLYPKKQGYFVYGSLYLNMDLTKFICYFYAVFEFVS